MTLPFWIYFVVAGIVFSAIMAVRSAREERDEEHAWIEKEGEVYLERIEEERSKKREHVGSN
ncbi:sporulation YhaL family protein [Mangrovibacillus cuniculi]|uniref:SigE-dependent sporulation protein n=1 Tax=Mangrovibacillus cuniculi TaxID=2593652 RepID=A0A7S8C9N8_9BACI|nr:sporulation YhaL family protein [Mangrovibacillus cuniculi]QPC45984.1 SigE-dependent sporulation protein [Mangrovibacillus cuniculi]